MIYFSDIYNLFSKPAYNIVNPHIQSVDRLSRTAVQKILEPPQVITPHNFQDLPSSCTGGNPDINCNMSDLYAREIIKDYSTDCVRHSISPLINLHYICAIRHEISLIFIKCEDKKEKQYDRKTLRTSFTLRSWRNYISWPYRSEM